MIFDAIANQKQVLGQKAPGSDQLSKYETNIRSKFLEVSAVTRKIDKWLAKQCILIDFHLFKMFRVFLFEVHIHLDL